MRYFIGECRDVSGDPTQSGRVKIRIYGKQDDTSAASDSCLQWAMPLQSTTSAATAKMGRSPTGMIAGSRVFGFYMDDGGQHPIILGTFARAGSSNNPNDNTGGLSDVVTANSDVGQAARGQNPLGTQSSTLTPNSRIDFTQVPAYNQAPYQSDGQGVDYANTARNMYANNSASWPSIAGIGKQDVFGSSYSSSPPSVLKMLQGVDPQSQSAMLPQAVSNFSKIISVGSSASTPSGAGGNGLLGSGLGSSLAQLSGTYGVGNIVGMLGKAMGTLK